MAERFKALDLRSTVERFVGSNPTDTIDVFHVKSFVFVNVFYLKIASLIFA